MRNSNNRISALDVLRGFALCGILLVNLPPHVQLPSVDSAGTVLSGYAILQDVVQNRFFPIFSFLFGIGFGIMWLSAKSRSPRPRLALLRRFLFLAVLGLGHQLLQPGEALLPYAIVALIVLLPSTWIPGRYLAWVTTALGVVFLGVGISMGGSLTLIPGLFLLGFAVGFTDGVRRALRHPGVLAVVVAVSAAITVLGFMTTDFQTRLTDQWLNASLGIVMAVGYVCVILLLTLTGLRTVLEAVFAPLGRMALSNYVGASLLIIAVCVFLPELPGLDSHYGYVAAMVICLAIIIVQIIVSTVWLRFFSQGPLEKLWRIVTWGPKRSNG